ncbi:MAG: hypothetical protein MJ068_02265 [Clostridia bacterium]|nr:hypothetical protein [Clostridia bacterium]
MEKIKKLLLITFISLLLVVFSGCTDLGNYTDEEEYYRIFSSVKTIDKNFGTDSYSMQDFYNPQTIEDFECPVDYDKYKYLCIKVEEDIVAHEISLWVLKEGEPVSLQVSLCVTKDVPESSSEDDDGPLFSGTYNCYATDGTITGFLNFYQDDDDDDKTDVTYENNGVQYKAQLSVDEDTRSATFYVDTLARSFKISLTLDGRVALTTDKSTGVVYYEAESSGLASATVQVSEEWSSFTFSEYNSNGKKSNALPIRAGSYIIMIFENNLKAAAAVSGLQSVEFKMTDIMIYREGEEE